MQEIESKQYIGAKEGAHIIYTVCFLAATSIIENKYSEKQCEGVNLLLLVNLVFYGLIIWATYQVITILPKYKNAAIKQFFSFMHGVFGIYMLAVFAYANLLYFDDAFVKNNCTKNTPILAFFTTLFIIVGYVILIIFSMSFFSSIFKRFSKQNNDETGAIEEL
ncbi:hypothetical protein ABPG74_021289 [Tetrahymena malaccensis]